MYPSPESALMNTRAASVPRATFCASPRSKSSKCQLITVPSFLARACIASIGEIKYVKLVVPEPQPMAKIPSDPPRSLKPLGPRRGGEASEPMTAMLLGLLRGSAPLVFFKRTMLAAAMSRTTFQWSSRTSTCSFLVSSRGYQALKLVSGYPESWPRKYQPARILRRVSEQQKDRNYAEYTPYSHIVNASLRNGTIIDISSQVPPKVRVTGAECDITRHGHVEAGNDRDGALGCCPVGHDF